MKKRQYIVEDFVLDDSFRNWVLQKDRGDEAWWEEWISSHPEARPVVEKAKEMVLGLKPDEVQVSQDEIDHQFEEIEKFFEKQFVPEREKSISLGFVVKVAASGLVLLAMGAGIFFYSQQSKPVDTPSSDKGKEKLVSAPEGFRSGSGSAQPKGKEKKKVDQQEAMPEGSKESDQKRLEDEKPVISEAGRKTQEKVLPQEQRSIQYLTREGEKKKVVLPDGSRVYMNENSRLAYSKGWTEQGRRKVRLEGEAFFRVEEKNYRGSKVKFIVATRDLEVEVTGTAFGVNTSQQKTGVYLNSGRVVLRLERVDRAITMNPGEVVEYNASTGALESRKTDQPKFLSWLEAFGREAQGSSTQANMTMNNLKDASGSSGENKARIFQSGDENSAYIDQVGNKLKSKQIQRGEGNQARAIIRGSRREAGDEAEWSTWQLQQGEGNVSIFHIVQSYNSNLYSIQQGSRNVARGQTVEGRDNRGIILQYGKENEAGILQKGTQNEAVILQKGHPGSGTGGSNFLQELLKGRYNTVNIIQRGYNNKARTVQQGQHNEVKVNQNGK
jgi:hypothetical protein